jgi:hypothetical protein
MGVWMGAVAVTLLLGWRSTAGPVLIAFTGTHGVHLSDLAVAVNAATGAALLTYLLVSPIGADQGQDRVGSDLTARPGDDDTAWLDADLG